MSTAMAGGGPTEAEIIAILDQLQASIPALDNTLGAVLVSTCLGTMLFGLTFHQTYRFFRLYPMDGPKLKLFVMLLFTLDVAHTVLCMHICYFYLVLNYFDPPRLLFGVWSIRTTIILTGIVILLSHLFYARRMFLLGGRRLWPVIVIGIAIVTEFGLFLAATVEAFLQLSFVEYRDFSWLICSALGTAVLVDIFVTISLIFYLRKSRTGFKRTDSMVDVMMVYAINTGLSTSIISLSACIAAITMPENLIYGGLYMVASKMYANSVLAVLNSRRSLVDKGMGLGGFETGSFGMMQGEPCSRSLSFKAKRSYSRNADVPLEELDGKTTSSGTGTGSSRASDRKSSYGGYEFSCAVWAHNASDPATTAAAYAVPTTVPPALPPLEPLRYQGA